MLQSGSHSVVSVHILVICIGITRLLLVIQFHACSDCISQMAMIKCSINGS